MLLDATYHPSYAATNGVGIWRETAVTRELTSLKVYRFPQHRGRMTNTLSAEVARTGADAVITINEAWTLNLDSRSARQGIPPSEAPDRREVLTVSLVTASNKNLHLMVPFRRGIKFEDTGEAKGIPRMLQSVRRV